MSKQEVVSKHLHEIASPAGEIIFKNKSDKPLFVLLKSPVSAYTSVVIFPPAGCYLAAAGMRSSVAYSSLHDYTGKMVHDENVYKDFLKWMRKEGIKKDFAPTILFQPYTRWGGGISTVGKKFDGTPFIRKIESVFVGNEVVGSVLAYFAEQLEEFQEWSFVCAERQGGGCEHAVYTLRNFKFEINGDVYRDSPIVYERNKWLGEKGELLIRNLEQVVGHLERGDMMLPDLPFPEILRVVPEIPWRAKFSDEESKRKCSLMRSKMISLLDFPWLYYGISDVAEEMREFEDEAIVELGRGVYEEVLSNLDSFVQKIRTKYPIVDANPLTMPVSN